MAGGIELRAWGKIPCSPSAPCPYPSTNMFKQFISAIPGADVYMIGSFLTFFAFFLLVGLYLFLADKRHMQQMSNLPLDESSEV